MFKLQGISIIIPTLNNVTGVELLLDSIKKCAFDFPYEIIVVSNFHNSELQSRLKLYSHVQYGFSGQLGVNKARNLGIQKAKYSFLYFFDDDCVVQDLQFFKKLGQKVAHLNEDLFCVGGGYTLPARSTYLQKAYQQVQMNWLKSGRLNSRNGNAFLLGGNCGGCKEIFDDVQFDESIIYGGSETDFFLRAYQKGYKIFYFSDLLVEHVCEMKISTFIKKCKSQAIGHINMKKKGLSFQPLFFQPDLINGFWEKWYILLFGFFKSWYSKKSVLSLLAHLSLKFYFKIKVVWQSFFSRIAQLIELSSNKKGAD
jgi:glycosyltransferase involved in cell wall biosynthesis